MDSAKMNLAIINAEAGKDDSIKAKDSIKANDSIKAEAASGPAIPEAKKSPMQGEGAGIGGAQESAIDDDASSVGLIIPRPDKEYNRKFFLDDICAKIEALLEISDELERAKVELRLKEEALAAGIGIMEYRSLVKAAKVKCGKKASLAREASRAAPSDLDSRTALDVGNCRFSPFHTVVKYKEVNAYGDKVTVSKRLSEFERGELASIGSHSLEFLPVPENMALLLEYYGCKLRHNKITSLIDVWTNGKLDGQVDEHIASIKAMCRNQRLMVQNCDLKDMLLFLALENSYNPWKNYLVTCGRKYDGKTDYIGQLCETLKLRPGMAEKERRMYLERYLVQMACVGTSEDGEETSQQFMIVLKGGQGDGKSRWLQHLLPRHFQEQGYFIPGRSCDLGNKDHVLEQATALLVEWGEIAATFKKSDSEQIKAYLTNSYDKLRPPYFHSAKRFKRRMCLCATVNDDEFLIDKTGSRRFAVLDCEAVNADHNVSMDGVWGQVWQLKESKRPYWFSKQEIAELIERNKIHSVADDLETMLHSLYDLSPSPEPNPKDWLSTLAIYSRIDAYKLNHGVKVTQNAITRALRRLEVKERISHKSPFFCITERIL
ncbi:MAG: virulence-associated E family protein [Clostridiales bacterium]|jgi:hypothetical protein|nr:virulence-associated E family protein [Clostridiales bacterium]